MKVKEVYIGVVPRPGDSGEIVPGRIIFNGKPINKGIYDADNVPPGFTWLEFEGKAKQYDGHGLTVIYEGQEMPIVKGVIDKSIAADDKLLRDRTKPPKEVKRDDDKNAGNTPSGRG